MRISNGSGRRTHYGNAAGVIQLPVVSYQLSHEKNTDNCSLITEIKGDSI